ncbi:hypothetical protein [Nioella nitratireducens]|uniref:hypothetical protein n=1 Tax=Nioella nitratireducens TaxID=1287720 RepID=UPI0008FD16B4|nr:hypothetical protein [Nioella nitratireducens]
MADRARTRIWTYRVIYLLFGISVILYRILPLDTGTPGLPGPDLILCVTLAWSLRQPATVPIWAVLVLFLLADFLLQRAPGLWTALALAALEFLRNRRSGLTEIPFLVEWGVIAGVVLAMILGERVVLWVLAAQQPSLGLTLMEGLATIVIYPVIVLFSKFLLGMDRLPAAELEPGRP